jgi:hypothetical protein
MGIFGQSLLILQIDNRERSPDCNQSTHYWDWTTQHNEQVCNISGWSYRFINFKDVRKDFSPHWTKPFGLIAHYHEFSKYDLVLYLDTDCWIRNSLELETILEKFQKSSDEILFSADEYSNDTLNAGVFCFRPSENYIRDLFLKAVEECIRIPAMRRYKLLGYYDQSAINIILQRNSGGGVCLIAPDKMSFNGTVVRHCWQKNRIIEQLLADKAI